MNDCFYSWIGCDGSCAGCANYASVNASPGSEMHDQYEAEVEAALAPIRSKLLEKLGGDVS